MKRTIAYFTMEAALDPYMKTYSGGLGVLSGDTLMSSADLNLPLVAVSLLNRKGYFHQTIDEMGVQHEKPDFWPIADYLENQHIHISVEIEGRQVFCTAWKYDVVGISGHKVPMLFLDTNLPENSEWDRTLTDHLYGADLRYRICQEIILGIGGIRMLRALGYTELERFHMNEGHAAFLILELLEERLALENRNEITKEDIDSIREKCVFTTHTPVAAGHDKFPMDLVSSVMGYHRIFENQDLYFFENCLNMTYLALNFSSYVNGVSKKNAEVAQLMYRPFEVDSITNGVHALRWTSKPFRDLYDEYIPGWRMDNFALRSALAIPMDKFWEAHIKAKQALLTHVEKLCGVEMDPNVLTIGFARRSTAYKRPDLIFHDLERLKEIIKKVGPIQLIYGGKAHPSDNDGKSIIQNVFRNIKQLEGEISIVYLPNYDLQQGKLITSGVDVWLNNPEPPMEASGTSGMKAALNGVPSLSILDGWWIEGCIEGVTGWSIDGERYPGAHINNLEDANSLYEKLEKVVIPLYYERKDQFIDIMLHCVALNGSFFNTERMVLQYNHRAY